MKYKSLIAAYFSLGAYALISQTMILREFFVVVYGNEFIFGVLLTNWLVGIFAGAITGGFFADKNKNNLRVFGLNLLSMAVLLPLAITGIRFIYSISGTASGTYISFANVFLYSAIFVVPISFTVGFSFPIAARLHTAGPASGGKRVRLISSIYVYESLGALIGGILYTFFFLGRFNAYAIIAFFLLPLLLSCWSMLKNRPYPVVRWISIFFLLVDVIVLTPMVSGQIEKKTVETRWRSFSQLPLIDSLDSRYQNIAVASVSSQYNIYLNSTLAAVFPNFEDNMLLAAHLVSQHPSPKRILVLGDAISGLARCLLKFDMDHILSVEIDPEVVKTIYRFLAPEEKTKLQQDSRFKIHIGDGRKLVKDLSDKPRTSISPEYDMVYINVPEPSTLLLNRYYTLRFFRDLEKILGKNGVVALRITGSENYSEGIVTDYTASIYNTLKKVFPVIAVSPGAQNFIFAARTQGIVSENPELLKKRYDATGVHPQRLGLIFYSLYPQDKTVACRKELDQKRDVRVNTDETPIAGFLFNKIIGWYGKSGVTGVLTFFQEIHWFSIVSLVMVLFFLRLNFVLVRRRRSMEPGEGSGMAGMGRSSLKLHTLLAVFSGGMAGLALELVLIYIFQNRFGDIFHIIGFLISLFMLGLPLGAATASFLIGRKIADHGTRGIVSVIAVLLTIAALSLVLPYMDSFINRYGVLSQLLILLQTVTIGFTIGVLFPLSINLYLGDSSNTGKAAGIINAFDHMGAAVGAFFIGSLFLPVMGVERISLLLSLFPILSALLLVTDIVKKKSFYFSDPGESPLLLVSKEEEK